MLRDFARQQGVEDYIEYCDDGYSGHDANRPSFIEINKGIEDKTISVVIIKCITHIFRNYVDSFEWLCGVERMG